MAPGPDPETHEGGAKALLREEDILRELDRAGATVGRPLSIVRVTGSTNDDARKAAAGGAPHGASFFADAQTKGRGRGAHRWYSPPGENLYLSLVLRPRVPATSLPPISLAVGAAVARSIEDVLANRTRVWVKWPNDVLAGPHPAAGLPRKIAGILVEGQLRGADVSSVVVGVGINVLATTFPSELEDRATSLALLGCVDLDRAWLAATICAAIGTAIARFESDRLETFLVDLARLDALRDVPIEVGAARGIGAGIDSQGHLLVREDTGRIIAIASGEVTVLA